MANVVISDIDGVGASIIGGFDRNLTVFTYDPAFGGYTWPSIDLPGYTNVLRGTGLSLSPLGGTVNSFHVYAPDGITVAYALTGVAVPFSTFRNGTSYFDPALGTVNVLGLGTLLLGRDVITGSAFADGISTHSGNDRIVARGGDDIVYAGSGNDTAYGGDGTDILFGGSDVDWLYGGNNDDLLVGESASNQPGFVYGSNHFFGGAGNDDIWLQDQSFFGGSPLPTSGPFTADGGAGFDRLFGSLTHITQDITLDLRSPTVQQVLPDGSTIQYVEVVSLALGSGNDTVITGRNGDQIFTGEGNDTVTWMGGTSSLIDLGAGDDTLIWHRLATQAPISPGGLEGGDGFDTLIANFSTFASAPITSTGFERISYTGTAGADLFYGPEGNDTFNGGGGNDELWTGLGNDRVLGAVGEDLLHGDAGNDTVYGGADADRVFGDGGDDFLFGDAGADTLRGGAGRDYLYGGADADVFVFAAGDQIDRIRDFVDGTDRIDLDAWGFTTFAQVAALATESAGVLTLRLTATDRILIDGLTLAQFDATDVLL